jgi:cytochrome c-type biogenesis protein CcmH
MTLFLALAALMLAAALLFVLAPLLRPQGRGGAAAEAKRLLHALNAARADGILSEEEYAAKRAQLGERLVGAIDHPAGRPRAPFPAAIAVALLLPAAAILLYRLIGAPAAIDAAMAPVDAQAPADHGQNMDKAITKLAEKLKQNPDDAEGWALLGRAYEATQRFDEARDALKHARDLAPNDPELMVAYAEVLAVSSPTRRIEGESRNLIDAALKAAPDSERGLWLLGISEYQAKRFDQAIAAWKHLLTVLPKDSNIAPAVRHEIELAEADRDGRPPPPEPADNEEPPAASTPEPGAAGPHLTVKVALDAKLKDKVAAGDVLFVYAKAASGPPMPVAIQRLHASDLPATVTLNDGMGMMPTLKLSQFPQVIVGARISRSGNAIAQSGDLQTVTKPLDVNTADPITLTIDQVVP